MKDQGGSASNVTANAGDVVGKRAGDDDRAAAEALVQRMRARRVRLRRPTMNEAPAIVPVPAATRASPGFPRSVTMRLITRHPVATLAVAVPAVVLLASNRPARTLVPLLASLYRTPVGALAASALLDLALKGRRTKPAR